MLEAQPALLRPTEYPTSTPTAPPSSAPIAVCSFSPDSHICSYGQQFLQCLPGFRAIGGLGGLRGIDAGKTH